MYIRVLVKVYHMKVVSVLSIAKNHVSMQDKSCSGSTQIAVKLTTALVRSSRGGYVAGSLMV